MISMHTVATFGKEYRWVGTALATLVAGVWAVTKYVETTKFEYLKDFHTRQMTIIIDAAKTVANLVADNNQTDWSKQQEAFWKLYYGELIIFEDQKIECAMSYFGVKLIEINGNFENKNELEPYAVAVSTALHDFVTELNNSGWNIKLGDLVGAKASVAPLAGVKANAPADPAKVQAAKTAINDKCHTYINAPPG